MLERRDLTPGVRVLGARLVGRVTELGRAAGLAGPASVHGDASLLNTRTGPSGEVVLLDWEGVSAGPGALVWPGCCCHRSTPRAGTR